MRTRISVLLLAPILLLAIACTEQLITTPHEALLSTGSKGVISEATSFQVIVLSTGNQESHATALNAGGFVAGFHNQQGTWNAVRWTVTASGDVSGPHLLGSLPAPFGTYVMQWPTAVNASGQVVGFAGSQLTQRRVAFLYQSGMEVLPPFGEDALNWSAAHVNDHGVVSGYIEYAVRNESGEIVGRETRGAVWFPPYEAEPALLPPLEGHHRSLAAHVSLSGVATGRSTETDESGNPVVSAVVRWEVQSGGAVGDPVEVAGGSPFPSLTAANEGGDIIGGSKLLRSGVVHELGGGANAIADPLDNGTVGIGGSSGSRAVVWSISAIGEVTGPIDLGLPSNRFSSATARGINSDHWAAGSSWTKGDGGTGRATLWMPEFGEGDDPPPPGDGPSASFDLACGNSSTCEFTDTSTQGTAAILSRDWVTGSQTASGSPVSFTFGTAGDHVVTLTVIDADEGSDQTSKTVTCRTHRVHGLRCS